MSTRVTILLNHIPVAIETLNPGTSVINLTGLDIMANLQRQAGGEPRRPPRRLAEADLIQVVVQSETPAAPEKRG